MHAILSISLYKKKKKKVSHSFSTKISPFDFDKIPITVLLSSPPHDPQMAVPFQQRQHPYSIADMLVNPWNTLPIERRTKPKAKASYRAWNL